MSLCAHGNMASRWVILFWFSKRCNICFHLWHYIALLLCNNCRCKWYKQANNTYSAEIKNRIKGALRPGARIGHAKYEHHHEFSILQQNFFFFLRFSSCSGDFGYFLLHIRMPLKWGGACLWKHIHWKSKKHQWEQLNDAVMMIPIY